MALVIHLKDNYKIDFSFFPSIANVRRFASMGKTIVELFWPDNKKLAFEIEVCLMEALSNVFYHAKNSHGEELISFQLRKIADKLSVRVFDHGNGFSLAHQFRKKTDLFSTKGRGLHLIRELTDSVHYRRGKGRNELKFEKKVAPLEIDG